MSYYTNCLFPSPPVLPHITGIQHLAVHCTDSNTMAKIDNFPNPNKTFFPTSVLITTKPLDLQKCNVKTLTSIN